MTDLPRRTVLGAAAFSALAATGGASAQAGGSGQGGEGPVPPSSAEQAARVDGPSYAGRLTAARLPEAIARAKALRAPEAR